MEQGKNEREAQILFVCTGNTCRSALAEAVARRLIEERGLPLRVASAGVSTLDGVPASEDAIRVGHEVGLDLSGHRARLLTPAMLAEAELVLVLAKSHLEFVRRADPDAARHFHLLRGYATRDRDRADVVDPIGRGPEVYRQTLRELEELVSSSLERFFDDARSPGNRP